MKGIYFFRWILDQGLMRFMISSLPYRYIIYIYILCEIFDVSFYSETSCRCLRLFIQNFPANKQTNKQANKHTNQQPWAHEQTTTKSGDINQHEHKHKHNDHEFQSSWVFTHVGNLDRSYMFWLGDTQSNNIKKLGNKQRYPLSDSCRIKIPPKKNLNVQFDTQNSPVWKKVTFSKPSFCLGIFMLNFRRCLPLSLESVGSVLAWNFMVQTWHFLKDPDTSIESMDPMGCWKKNLPGAVPSSFFRWEPTRRVEFFGDKSKEGLRLANTYVPKMEYMICVFKV